MHLGRLTRDHVTARHKSAECRMVRNPGNNCRRAPTAESWPRAVAGKSQAESDSFGSAAAGRSAPGCPRAPNLHAPSRRPEAPEQTPKLPEPKFLHYSSQLFSFVTSRRRETLGRVSILYRLIGRRAVADDREARDFIARAIAVGKGRDQIRAIRAFLRRPAAGAECFGRPAHDGDPLW
jgi:hypothetical protein